MQKFIDVAIRKYSNIKMVCPFPKNNYYMRNVGFHDSDITPIFPDKNVQITVTASGIPVGKTRFQEIYTIQTVALFKRSLF